MGVTQIIEISSCLLFSSKPCSRVIRLFYLHNAQPTFFTQEIETADVLKELGWSGLCWSGLF